MNIALHDADMTGFPNLALMKLSAWHKARGDTVSRYMPIMSCTYDKVYSSRVFTFKNHDDPIGNVEKGGVGWGKTNTLTEEIEHTCPDYTIFNSSFSQGFLTRGCPNKCGWCVVPRKEGAVRAHADIEEFAKHKAVVLMDNNVLAHDHGIAQIEKMARLGLKVDFNQGLDARRIDDSVAKRLASLKWLNPVRLACDQKSQMDSVGKAVSLLRKHGTKPKNYFCYVLVKDIDDALERVEFLRSIGVDPFAQPYRDFENKTEPTQEQKKLSRWVNHKAIFKTVKWEEYR